MNTNSIPDIEKSKLQELLDYSKQIYTNIKEYDIWLEQYYPNHNAFKMIRNFLLLTWELLYFYNNEWIYKNTKYLRADEIERIITITRWAFVSTFSIIEYVTKIIIKNTNHEYFDNINMRLKKGKRVSYRNILKTSKKVGLINDGEYMAWDVLTELRNSFVHNNAIMDKDGSYEINGLIIVLKKDEGLMGELSFCLKLIDIITKLHRIFLHKIIK